MGFVMPVRRHGCDHVTRTNSLPPAQPVRTTQSVTDGMQRVEIVQGTAGVVDHLGHPVTELLFELG